MEDLLAIDGRLAGTWIHRSMYIDSINRYVVDVAEPPKPVVHYRSAGGATEPIDVRVVTCVYRPDGTLEDELTGHRTFALRMKIGINSSRALADESVTRN